MIPAEDLTAIAKTYSSGGMSLWTQVCLNNVMLINRNLKA